MTEDSYGCYFAVGDSNVGLTQSRRGACHESDYGWFVP